MIASIAHWFVLLIYQPFLNLLVFFYWGIDQITGNPNMGIAVILLTIVIRLLLLPQSLHGIKSERKKVGLQKKIAEIEQHYSADPVEMVKKTKHIMRSNPAMVIGEIINIIIQVLIALMLWRMFSTGLTGQDLHLIYGFMPYVETPFNLIFMGIHLNEPSFFLNIVLMMLVFILESLSLMAAIPGSISRTEALKAQLVLPVVSFIFFSFMPAGKKLFVITTVIFSIVLTILRLILVRFDLYQQKQEAKEAQSDGADEPIVIENA